MELLRGGEGEESLPREASRKVKGGENLITQGEDLGMWELS